MTGTVTRRWQEGRLVEWPPHSGQYAVSALLEDGPDEGLEIWFSLLPDGRWYVSDGHLDYDDHRIIVRFAQGCNLSLRAARRLLTSSQQEVE